MMKKPLVPILLLVIFILPIISSGVLYFYYDYFHFQTTNYGRLITPPIQVANTEQKWQIIYLSKNHAVKHETILHSLMQIKKALGKDSERVLVGTNILTLPEDKIYLVDPLGNVFMYYDESENPMHILKDLKKVLGVSQIG
jgi:hypothetical protein